MLADWPLSKREHQYYDRSKFQTKVVHAVAKNWSCVSSSFRYDPTCGRLTFGVVESRLALLKRGYRVTLMIENMRDEREFAQNTTETRTNIFLESIGVKKPKA